MIDDVDIAIGLGHVSLDNGGIDTATLDRDDGIRSLAADVEVQESVVVHCGYLGNLSAKSKYNLRNL